MKFFKISKESFNSNIFISLFVLALILVTSFLIPSDQTKAQVDTGLKELNGYAWSSNIGWISMNCRNTNSCAQAEYKIILDEDTGSLTGYGWSSNVGWLQFGGLSGFPSGSGTRQINANLSDDVLEGWARFLSNGDGWDGWVSLSGTSYGPVKTDGVEEDTLSGYAWGDDVVGWVSFDHAFGGVTIDDATAQCGSIHNTTVNSKPNANLCEIGEETTVLENNQRTWGWSCITDDLTPSKNSICSASCENNEWICDDSCIPLTQSCGTGPNDCPSGYVIDPVTGDCKPPIPIDPNATASATILGFEAIPRIINPGESCNMNWRIDTTNADLINCSITSDFTSGYEDDVDLMLTPGSSGEIVGEETFGNIDATTEYTLTCRSYDPVTGITGAVLGTPQSARCLINPNFQEF